MDGTLKGSYMQFFGVDKQERGCLVLCCTASAFKNAPEPARLLFVTCAMCVQCLHKHLLRLLAAGSGGSNFHPHGLDSSDMLGLAQLGSAKGWHGIAQRSAAQRKNRVSWQSTAQHGTAQPRQHSTAQTSGFG